jgi:hypothetical protein
MSAGSLSRDVTGDRESDHFVTSMFGDRQAREVFYSPSVSYGREGKCQPAPPFLTTRDPVTGVDNGSTAAKTIWHLAFHRSFCTHAEF